MIKEYLQNNLFSFLLVVIFVSFFILTIGLAWTEPTAAPPGGNVSAPLNVGPTGQVKRGGLTLNTGGASIGLVVVSGNVGIGITDPQQKLDVAGGYIRSDTGFCIKNDCITGWPAGGGGEGPIPWSRLTNFPPGCPSGQFVTAVGSNLTCATPPSGGGAGGGGEGPIPWSRLTNFPPGCPSGQFVTAVGSNLTCTAPTYERGITRLDQGTGIILSPNPITQSGTISADTNYLQRRINGKCQSGYAIREIRSDGSVVCEQISGGGSSCTYSSGAQCHVIQSCPASAGTKYQIFRCNNGTWETQYNCHNQSYGSYCGQ
jgi:hypothetical protein